VRIGSYLFYGLVAFIILVPAGPTNSQNPLRKYQIAGLRDLKDLKVVFQPHSQNIELLTMKELDDLITVFLRQKIPKLNPSQHEKVTTWLALEYRTPPNGGFIRLVLYRWAIISDTRDELFMAAWDDSRLVTGTPNRQVFKEILESLLTGFAADYYRANQ